MEIINLDKINTFNFEKNKAALKDFEEYEVEPIIEGLINKESLYLLFAPSGGMKTFFALDLAIAVAQGTPFLGADTVKSSVLYIDGEMSGNSVNQRWNDFGNPDLDEDELCYMCVHSDNQSQGVNFSRNDDKEAFLEFLRREPYEVVILDSIRTLFNIKDENDSTSFYKVNRFLLDIRDTGSAVVVLHHSNKGGEDYSGSSNIASPYNGIIGLIDTPMENVRKIVVRKDRDDSLLRSLSGKQVEFSKENKKFVISGEAEPQAIAQRIIDYICKNKPGVRSLAAFIRNDLQLSLSSADGNSRKGIFNKLIKGHNTQPFLQDADEFAEFCEDPDGFPELPF